MVLPEVFHSAITDCSELRTLHHRITLFVIPSLKDWPPHYKYMLFGKMTSIATTNDEKMLLRKWNYFKRGTLAKSIFVVWWPVFRGGYHKKV